jgi:hypothetical protein
MNAIRNSTSHSIHNVCTDRVDLRSAMRQVQSRRPDVLLEMQLRPELLKSELLQEVQ